MEINTGRVKMSLDWTDAAGASTWNKLFDRYYRRSEIYSMQWENVDLAKMIVAGSKFSGPLGMNPLNTVNYGF